MSVLPEAWKPENLPPTPDQHRYIGSGDVASIVALYRSDLSHMAKGKSAADVWLRLVHGLDLKKKGGMDRGLREENPLRITYRQTVGPVSDLPGMIQHPRFPWAGGSPDGLGLDRVVELKTSSIYAMDQWGETSFENPTDLVPDHYNFQCQWLCGLCGFSLADLFMGFGKDVKFPCPSCYIGPRKRKPSCDACGGTGREKPDEFQYTETRLYRIHFNPELFAECERFAETFYDSHVRTRLAPPVLPVDNKREWKRLTR